MSRLEFSIAWRYLRSRRGSKLLSLISVIAIGGVVVGVSALIVIMGVMTGLQDELREKILIGSPDIRVMTMGSDMVMKGWEPVLKTVRAQPGVVAASPFVMTKAIVSGGHKYSDGAIIMGMSFATDGPKVDRFALRPLFWILLSIVIFGLLAKTLGLAIAILALVVVAAYGGHEFKWGEVLIAGFVLALFSVLVFVYGLKLPFPVWPTFITG